MRKAHQITLAILLCSWGFPAGAQDTMAGTVSDASDPLTTVQITSELASWAKVGKKLVAAGGVAEIVEIKGNSIVLKPGPKAARRIKPEAKLIMREASDADIKACGI